MSDQGCPNLEDPASKVLDLVYSMKQRVKIEVIPGPSSVTAAISACPFDMKTFFFKGFLPKDDTRAQQLSSLAKNPSSIILLDTPYRLSSLLYSCKSYFGSRRGFLALDISNENENYVLGSFSKLIDFVEKHDIRKTNFVLIVENICSKKTINSKQKSKQKIKQKPRSK